MFFSVSLCTQTEAGLLSPLREVQGVVCSYLHQKFISDPALIKLVHFQVSLESVPPPPTGRLDGRLYKMQSNKPVYQLVCAGFLHPLVSGFASIFMVDYLSIFRTDNRPQNFTVGQYIMKHFSGRKYISTR